MFRNLLMGEGVTAMHRSAVFDQVAGVSPRDALIRNLQTWSDFQPNAGLIGVGVKDGLFVTSGKFHDLHNLRIARAGGLTLKLRTSLAGRFFIC